MGPNKAKIETLIAERNKNHIKRIIKLNPNRLVRFKPANTDLHLTADEEIYILYQIMTSVICFMMSILCCRNCNNLKCDGSINCPRLSPHDEANCSQQCPPSPYWSDPIPCDCNKPGNMTCEAWGLVCYDKYSRFLVSFYFCKYHTCCKIKPILVCFKRLFYCDITIISLN